jgi:hypothetical protein
MTTHPSTGPRTEAGKAASSRNAIACGLYTRHDYVKPEHLDLYNGFRETLYADLAPANALEQSLAAEIASANWRLHLCAEAEAALPGFLTEETEKTQRSIERARAASHSLLHRSINQLRRLQTERITRHEILNAPTLPDWIGLADYKSISQAVMSFRRNALKPAEADPIAEADLEALLDGGPPLTYDEYTSFCKQQEEAEKQATPEAVKPITAPRNAPCPCGSGQKFKRCCARTGPAWANSQPIAA